MGYEIPVSLSSASAFTVPQSITSPTIFNFGSGDVEGGRFDTTQSPIAPVTATATSALGDASSQATVPINASDNTKLLFGLVVLSLIATGVTVWAVLHKH